MGVTLAHIAFWDGRVLALIDKAEHDGKVTFQGIDVVVNDISLALWQAIPPGESARIAIDIAEQLDRRLESLSPDLLEQLAGLNTRFIERAIHRGEHLDEIDRALSA